MSNSERGSFPAPEYTLWTLGQSHDNRPLDALAIAPCGARDGLPEGPRKSSWPWLLFLGGVHGDEVEGIWALEEIRTQWTKVFPFKNLGVIVWAQVNPDGTARGQRWNAQNIDLNRNLPSKDWTPEIKNPRYPPGLQPASEPENKALVRLIKECQPFAILSVHSFSQFQVNVNGPRGPTKDWAEALANVCQYPVTEDIGYPTPGSLGSYAGIEMQIPTITLEIERGLNREKVLDLHVPVLKAAAEYWDKKLGEKRS